MYIKTDNDKIHFCLTSVILYNGDGLSGHYRLLYLDKSTQTWLLSDDESTYKVSKSSLTEFLTNSSEPSGLIYERVMATLPPTISSGKQSHILTSSKSLNFTITSSVENKLDFDIFDIHEKHIIKDVHFSTKIKRNNSHKPIQNHINIKIDTLITTKNLNVSKPFKILKRDENKLSNIVLDKTNDKISILFSNVNGLKRKDKINSLYYSTTNDSIICLNETNFSDTAFNKSKFIRHGLGKESEICSANKYFIKKGKMTHCDDRSDITKPHLNTKSKGYGTCVVVKTPSNINFLYKDEKYEIIVTEYKLKNPNSLRGLIVTVYRSPSMTNIGDNTNFFTIISTILNKHLAKRSHFIIYIGDDNISSKSDKRIVELRQSIFEEFRMDDLIEHQSTRNKNQPDSCFAYFDRSFCTISALAIGKLHHLMDHSAIRISIVLKGIVPRLPKFNKKVTRKVRKLSDKEIKELFVKKYEHWIGDLPKDYSTWDEILCEKAASGFSKIIDEVREQAWKTIEYNIEENIDEKQSAQQVRIQMELANLEKLAMQIKLEPHRIGLRNQFAKKQEKLTEYRRIEAANILAKDMEYQDVYSSTSCKRAFSVCTNVYLVMVH